MVRERVLQHGDLPERSKSDSIAKELASIDDHFSSNNARQLQLHGIYQQNIRDRRSLQSNGNRETPYEFAVRLRASGNKVTTQQMLGLFDLADEFGDGGVILTARQGVQLNGVVKEDLKTVVRRIYELRMTTLAAGGDVSCNVMGCPAPVRDDAARQQLQKMVEHLSERLMPSADAYQNLWLRENGRPVQSRTPQNGNPLDPIYGKTCLPHKLKIGLAMPEDNCVDVYAQDIGFLAVRDGDQIAGYNMLVGGGMGMVLASPYSFPALAKPLAFVTPDEVLDAVLAVIRVYRDLGSRDSTATSRLKYLVHTLGFERFKSIVEEYYGQPLAIPQPDDVTGVDDHLGWHQQGDGMWYLGLHVERGRFEDEEGGRLKSAVREVLPHSTDGVRFTAQKNLLLCGIPTSHRDEVEAVLARCGVSLVESLSPVRRGAMVCPALPNCRSAITESERIAPGVLDFFEAELACLGLSDEPIAVRIAGCPNGCSRSYLADIALIGRSRDIVQELDRFAIFLGGDSRGRRLNLLYKDQIPLPEVIDSLRRLLRIFKQTRQYGESLGTFCARIGTDRLRHEEQAIMSRCPE
ncbi:MAG TPA: NADPH-dependent assimilatory sulfite reductase hemoprotein subunit [Pirellulales bacterium]|jgi:sulfite reductase (ferredoxin)|nr:NADPH-dependent assimilatory sulfite reductase hemoprotein subunit [SAR202 cluster bacterium]HJN65723.1 NADPH-dependent assimilatory sulfite reductase hemoprotein subunit [Pirellulales bacterium]